MKTLTVTTPFGTFTRQTASRYTHVALAYHEDGSPVQIVGAAAIAARKRGLPQSTQYLAKFSTSAAGAVKLALTYPYDRNLSAHGPYAIDQAPTAPAVEAPVVVEETPAMAVVIPSTAGTAWTPATATIALASGKPVLAVSIKNAAITHAIKLDKNQAPRTYCGVPIGNNGGMVQTKSTSTTCPTCTSALAKATPAEAAPAVSPAPKARLVNSSDPIGTWRIETSPVIQLTGTPVTWAAMLGKDCRDCQDEPAGAGDTYGDNCQRRRMTASLEAFHG